MSSALTSYTGSNAVSRRSPQPGGATDTSALNFTGAVPTWLDLPLISRQTDAGSGDLVAEDVEDYAGFARKIQGIPHQIRLAWRAYTDRIVIIRVGRPLTSRPDGALAPNGPWQHLESTTHHALTAPTRTQGSVPADLATEPATPATADAAAVPREHQRAADLVQYLPPRVRTTFMRAVPDPVIWSGSLLRYTLNDKPNKHTLQMLRLTASDAAVIHATRTLDQHSRLVSVADASARLANLPWTVTQVVYELGEPAGALGAASARGQIGRR